MEITERETKNCYAEAKIKRQGIDMEALQLFENEQSATQPKAKRLKLDQEFLEELQAWPMLDKTLNAEIELLTAYHEAHGFERDLRRLNSLNHYLENKGA